MTVRLVGLWTKPADVDAFERAYLGSHFPQLAQLTEAVKTTTSRAFDGPYFRLTEVTFETTDAIQTALGDDQGRLVLAGAEALAAKFGVRLDVLVVAEPS